VDAPRTVPATTPPTPLPPAALRWRCDPARFPFETTTEVEPARTVVGQDAAFEALRFGLATHAPGQNIYVRGLTGTGRATLVRHLLEETRLSCTLIKDCCYVHNFGEPDRPRLITLPPGRGVEFRRRVDRLIDFIRENLSGALAAQPLQDRRASLEQAAEQELQTVVKPFEEALEAAGFALVRIQAGPVVQTSIYPVHDGKPVPPDEYDALHEQGRIDDATYAAVRARHAEFERQLAGIGERVGGVRRTLERDVQNLLAGAARWILGEYIRGITDEFPDASVRTFLGELADDVIEHRLSALDKTEEFIDLYRVNVVLDQKPDGCPIVLDPNPTARSLLGTIDYDVRPGEDGRATHLGIRAGSLLRADGGYLILEARDVLSEPGAWRALVRTLRSGQLEISPPDLLFPFAGPSLRPEEIPLNVKVVLLGDADLYYALDAADPDFPHLFKVLADFDAYMPRTPAALDNYAAILARIAREEQLPPFDRHAVAAWCEHGARIAARHDRLTARFGRLADVAREAAFVAVHAGRPRVSADDVRAAVRRTKERASLPSRRFRELVADGALRIDTRGAVVGQVNGLAVLQAGPLTYGFPSRITATIGPGTAGVINIEREAELSGSIHTKGFYILGGLLRHLLRTDHPLAFSASVTFEQSYGEIDGDSASGAEACCLLSALTDIPLRQDLAMTGAIDQHGHVQAIGAVNEKIEGFFDTCRDLGLTGTQGVIIPQANAGDLMLREDVVAACAAGQFHVYVVSWVHEALTLFTGVPAGERDAAGAYPPGSLLAQAVEKARLYWLKAARGLADAG